MDKPSTKNRHNSKQPPAKCVTVGMNEDVIGWRMAFELYPTAEAGLREVIANAVTSAENAISEGIIKRWDSMVSVSFYDDGRLVIEDNGTGISKKHFEEFLIVMGSSSNKKGDRPGYLGMGFYGFMKVSTVATIETVTKDGESYTAICRDARMFDVFDGCKKDTRGTRITLMPYHEEQHDGQQAPVNREALLRMAHRIGEASAVGFHIHVDSDPLPVMDSNDVTFKPVGMEKIAEINRTVNNDWNPLIITSGPIEIVLGIADSEPSVYLAGMPIEAPEDLPSHIAVNIHDERKYEPMPDRCTLTEDAQEKLVREVGRALSREYESWKIDSYHDYRLSENQHNFIQIMHRKDHRQYWPNFGEIMYIMKDHFVSADGDGSLLDMMEKAGSRYIAYSQTAKGRYALELNMESKAYLIRADFARNKDAAWCAKEWGIPDVWRAFRKLGLSVEPLSTSIDTIKFHVKTNKYQRSARLLRQLSGGMELVMLERTGCGRIIDIARRTEGNTAIAAYNGSVISHPDIIPYSRWISGVLSKAVETNRGDMTVSELVRKKFILLENGLKYKSYMADYPSLVVTDGLTQTEAALACHHENVKPKFDLRRGDDLIYEMYMIYQPDPDKMDAIRPFFTGLDKIQQRMMVSYANCYGSRDSMSVREALSMARRTRGPHPRDDEDRAVRILKQIWTGKMGRAESDIAFNMALHQPSSLDNSDTGKKSYDARVLREVILPVLGIKPDYLYARTSESFNYSGILSGREIDLTRTWFDGKILSFHDTEFSRDGATTTISGTVRISYQKR